MQLEKAETVSTHHIMHKIKEYDNCTMTVKNHETYIGEIICTSGSNVKDIKNQKISEKYHKSKCLKI